MRITVSQLRRIIKEEVNRVISEANMVDPPEGFIKLADSDEFFEGELSFMNEELKFVSRKLKKPLSQLYVMTSESDYWENYLSQVKNEQPVREAPPDMMGLLTIGTLMGQPVLVVQGEIYSGMYI